jgi:hypothetical protein
MYTGVDVAGTEQNTSIGIGYVGESYIDFGPFGMFIPIFLLGAFYGLVYRLLVTKTRYKLLGSSIAVAVLIFNAYAIETSNTKLFGSVLGVTIVSAIFYKVFAGVVTHSLRRSTG